MNPKQLRTSALNLRTRAATEDNEERAAAWKQEAADLEAQAAEIEKKTTPPAAKGTAPTP